jgi:hypothetical protein
LLSPDTGRVCLLLLIGSLSILMVLYEMRNVRSPQLRLFFFAGGLSSSPCSCARRQGRGAIPSTFA